MACLLLIAFQDACAGHPRTPRAALPAHAHQYVPGHPWLPETANGRRRLVIARARNRRLAQRRRNGRRALPAASIRLRLIVVGETARSMNFSLNGYARHTNPRFAAQQKDLVNLSKVSSHAAPPTGVIGSPACFSDLQPAKTIRLDKAAQPGRPAGCAAPRGLRCALARQQQSGCKGVPATACAMKTCRSPVAGDPLCNSGGMLR
jgi:hypothetical protein